MDDFSQLLGQEHLTSKDSPLRILCEKGVLGHSFFFGPAGCGKTSIIRIIALKMELPFYEFNATSLKIEQLRKVFEQYKNTLQRPFIFIDEIHRLSKNQQEVLLPVMENNSVLIMGASTQNPFFSLTSAIRSRSQLFELKAIHNDALQVILNNALDDSTISLDDDAYKYMIFSSGGDARAMLRLLEQSSSVNTHITLQTLKSLRPNALSMGSSEAGFHYDYISALIKAMRANEVDFAIYNLAKLIDGGESADFIARRLVIFASEDVGNANPQALTLCTSTLTSVSNIGYPEAKIILAQAVVYLCASPKSTSSYLAIKKALKAIGEGKDCSSWKFIELNSVGYEKKMKDWLHSLSKFN